MSAMNVERRRWDKDKYERRAQDRIKYGDEYVDGKADVVSKRVEKEEFRAAESDAIGPAGSKRAFLKARSSTLGLDKDAGRARILTDVEMQQKGTGWYCEVCDCLVTDSASYLAHVNGVQHQRKLGYSMRVQRVGVDAVRQRFARLKKERFSSEEQKRGRPISSLEDWEARIEKTEHEFKEERKHEQQQRKKIKTKQQTPSSVDEEGQDNEDDEAAQINALMGFGAFGASKKS